MTGEQKEGVFMNQFQQMVSVDPPQSAVSQQMPLSSANSSAVGRQMGELSMTTSQPRPQVEMQIKHHRPDQPYQKKVTVLKSDDVSKPSLNVRAGSREEKKERKTGGKSRSRERESTSTAHPHGSTKN